MDSVVVSLIVFVCLFGGALLGFFLHGVLPEPHLTPESRQAVGLGMAVIGTMSGLVLGLLVASAKGTFDAESNELMDASAKAIFLNQILTDYGPDANEARTIMYRTLENAMNRIWPHEHTKKVKIESDSGVPGLYREIQNLKPHDDAHRAMRDQAMSLTVSLMQTRSLAVVQQGVATSKPLLVTLIFWFTINFTSIGLFAPRNATVIVTLLLCALAVSGAVLLIVELSNPLGGLFRVSSEPMRLALQHLGQ